MNDRVVHELVQALVSPHVQSLVMVPSEQPATLHVRPGDVEGWVLTLDCRRVLCDLLQAVVVNSASGPSPGRCSTSWLGHNCLHVVIEAGDARLLRRLLQVVVDDHVRTRPTMRLAAIVLEDDAPAAHRIEVVRPPQPKPVRSASLQVLPLPSRMATARV